MAMESFWQQAALLIAYYLAAGKTSRSSNCLINNIVLLDPSINLRLSRFAQWAKLHKSASLVTRPQIESIKRPGKWQYESLWF